MPRQLKIGALAVSVHPSNQSLGEAAAHNVAATLRAEIARQGEAAIILATGNSQLSFMRHLRQLPEIAWDKISVFHMDEYLGMDEAHPASFRHYIRQNLINHVHPRAFFGMAGDEATAEAEIERYTALLAQHRPCCCVMGIGENGHLAFNDPPADFETRATVHVVQLDHACRQQQVGEGHFANLAAVPMHALSLTIHALLQPPKLFVVVPESRKAKAVADALGGPVSPHCPASILQVCAHAHLYLDEDSSATLPASTDGAEHHPFIRLSSVDIHQAATQHNLAQS
jgi:glucosamine-6-phosphate deaminase